MSDDSDANRLYVVLLNDEGQYSLWPKEKQRPAGWRLARMEGSKAECSKYVDSVWTDMRPSSLRRKVTLH
jgi:MbtH protein